MSLRYLARALAAVVTVAMLGEVAVRVFALGRDRETKGDPDRGWVVPAGSVVRWGSEGWGTTHYVGDGEVETPRRGEGPTVAVLGDSHTEAYQVNDSQKFVSVAESLLWRRGKRLDLRNFGRSGCSFADYVWLTRAFRERLRPAAFVIQLDEADFDGHAFDSRKANYFVARPDGRIELVHRPTAPWASAPSWREASHLANYVRYRIGLFSEQPGRQLSTPPSGLSTADSVAQQAALLREAASGVPVILMRLPYSPYSSERRDLGWETFTALQRALPDWPLIDTSAEFRASRERGHDPRTFWNSDPFGAHLNADGHAIAGRMLAAELERGLAR